jgi:hypothetical protein
MGARKVLFVNYDSLTDALMLTAAVRDMQTHSYGGYVVDVHTLGMPLWDYNPYISRLDWRAVPYDGESELAANEYGFPEHKTKIICYDTEIQVVYCSAGGSFAASSRLKNLNAYHRIHSFGHDIADKLGLSTVLPIGELKGVVNLSDIEKSWISQVEESKNFKNFWLIQTGGPDTQSSRWWDVERYQRVVDEFKDKITFVQVGAAGEHHPRLNGVLDFVGKTDIRQIIRLMYHAAGYVGAPGFLMHLAAATPTRPYERNGRPRPPVKAAVIISGGQEPYQWFAYENHQILHTNGMLPCCEVGGCGKTRCEVKHRLEPHPEQLCSLPVPIGRDRIVPKCLDMITVKMVVDRIAWHFEGGAYFYDNVPFEPPKTVPEAISHEEKKEKKKAPKKDGKRNRTTQESGELAHDVGRFE